MSRKPFIAGNWKMNKIQKKQKHSLRPLHQNFLSNLVEAGIAAPAVDLTALFLLLPKVQKP